MVVTVMNYKYYFRTSATTPESVVKWKGSEGFDRTIGCERKEENIGFNTILKPQIHHFNRILKP